MGRESAKEESLESSLVSLGYLLEANGTFRNAHAKQVLTSDPEIFNAK